MKILNVFNISILKQIFWKTKIFFKKLEGLFLVESTKIENVSFPYKTAIPEANVKTIEWWVQTGPITKSGVLPVTTLFFWRFYFSLRTSSKELILYTNSQMPIFVLFVSAGVLVDGVFTLWVSLRIKCFMACLMN